MIGCPSHRNPLPHSTRCIGMQSKTKPFSLGILFLCFGLHPYYLFCTLVLLMSSTMFTRILFCFRSLPPSVELFRVDLLRNGVRAGYPGPPIPIPYPGWNLRRGPAPVPSPADPASNRVADPLDHRRWNYVVFFQGGVCGHKIVFWNYFSVVPCWNVSWQEARKHKGWIWLPCWWEPGRCPEVNILIRIAIV